VPTWDDGAGYWLADRPFSRKRGQSGALLRAQPRGDGYAAIKNRAFCRGVQTNTPGNAHARAFGLFQRTSRDAATMVLWFDLLRPHVAGVRAILQQHMYPLGRVVKLFSRKKVYDNLL
jgi:hypothetical protein